MLNQWSQYELFFCGRSSKGELFTGDLVKHEIPEFIRFSNDGAGSRSLPINEPFRWISIGLEFTVVVTCSNRVYLFGDYLYDIHSKFLDVNGRLLPVINDGEQSDRFTVEPIEVECGEQFVCVRDCMDRIWYSGVNDFGQRKSIDTEVSYQFHNLDWKKVMKNDHLKITHFKVGGRHVIVCWDNHLVASIGANYSKQLGINSLECSSDFVKVPWNESGDYRVRFLECSSMTSCIITGR